MKIVLAPTYEQALDYQKSLQQEGKEIQATVEAEYGAKGCIEGTVITMAHHQGHEENPAPCNWDGAPVLSDDSIILVSHLDLDTVGGIARLMGIAREDPTFWDAAETVDLEGARLRTFNKLNQEDVDRIEAYSAIDAARPRIRYTDITDVTEDVMDRLKVLDAILDEQNPAHKNLIENGRTWVDTLNNEIESKLVFENGFIRAFETDGVFCNAAYDSPSLGISVPAIASLNTARGSLTLSFDDNGALFNAAEIMQNLFGEGAGGRTGIAGSPRGQTMSSEDLQVLIEDLNSKYCQMGFVPNFNGD